MDVHSQGDITIIVNDTCFIDTNRLHSLKHPAWAPNLNIAEDCTNIKKLTIVIKSKRNNF